MYEVFVLQSRIYAKLFTITSFVLPDDKTVNYQQNCLKTIGISPNTRSDLTSAFVNVGLAGTTWITVKYCWGFGSVLLMCLHVIMFYLGQKRNEKHIDMYQLGRC